MRYFLKIIIILTLCFNCNSSKLNDSTTSSKTISILFVGNSLTYTNNLPELVKSEAKSKGINLKTKMLALPNYALLDHWNDGIVQKEIQSKIYDYVIVQQGPSSQAFGKEILINYGKKYNNLCKVNGAQLCYFMVWPSISYYKTFDGVIKNHKEAARLNDALLIPVGEIWKSYFETTGHLDYYSEDGFHPSIKGSQIAAKTIVQYLFVNTN